MTSLPQSLADHVSGLEESEFDRLLDARPDVVEALGLDEADGPTQVSVAAAVSALSDADGAFFALARFPLPHLYVVALLVAGRESVRIGGRGGSRRRELSQDDWARVLADFGAVFASAHYGDLEAARSVLGGAGGAAGSVLEGIIDELVDAALMWPEQGRLRLHDALIGSFDVEAVLSGADAEQVLSGPPPIQTAAYLGPDPAGASRGSALAALEEAERLFGAIASEPVALLKAGGVGAREIKRLGKAARLNAARVRLWLHMGEAAGLIGEDESQGRVLATGGFDAWSASEPAQRFLALVNGWIGMAAFPLAAADAGRAPAPLAEAAYQGPASLVRTAVLAGLRATPADRVAAAESLAEQVAWSLPMLLGVGGGSAVVCSCGEVHEPDADELWLDPGFAVAQVLAEAEVLGVAVGGALAPWFRFDVTTARPGGEIDESAIGAIVEALGSVLPPAVSQVRLQGDLTAVASGLPSAALAALLDGCARRESSGAAAVWRFSDGSIRAFLDDGGDAEELLARLRHHSFTGTVPQVLEYLIKDAARRHGLIDVIATSAVLVAADEHLAAEIEAHRSLGSLALRRIAPTVLASAAGPAAVLDALRFAGFAPSAHQAGGAVLVTKTPGPRLRG